MVAKIKPLFDLPGFSASTMEKYPVLSEEKHRELGKRLRENGDEEARKLLILHNMRFVLFIAQKRLGILSQKTRSAVEMSDLVQEGMCGLMTAVERWDYRKGFLFTTYARWWIQVRIANSLWESGVIHIPTYTHKLAYKSVAMLEEFAQREGRAPSVEEVARMLKVTRGRASAILYVLNISVLSMQDAVPNGRSSSLDDAWSVEDVIASEHFLAPDRALEGKQELHAARERINEIIKMVKNSKKIREKNKGIFLQYYGLDETRVNRGWKYLTKKYGVSNQRVYQILNLVWKHLKKMQPAIDSKNLADDLTRIFELEDVLDYSVTIG